MNPVARIILPSAVLSLGLLGLPAAAHPTMAGCRPGPADPAPNIVVQGQGRASVAPDLATVSLGVTTQATTAAQAMADNAARQTAIVEALRAQGVAPADLQTQGLSLSPMQDFSREGQPPTITGYQAQNIVSARVRDLARLGPMLDAMVAAGATDVQGISFSREDAAATEDEARREAVTEARRRAEVIARAAGVELGPLISLTDMSMSEGPRPLAMMARAAESDASTPIEAGELTLTAQVTGVWSLIDAGAATGACAPRGPMGMHGHAGPHGHMEMNGHGHGGFHGHPGPHGMMPCLQDGRACGPNARERPRNAPGADWQPAPAPEPVEPPGVPQPMGDASAQPAPNPDATAGAVEGAGTAAGSAAGPGPAAAAGTSSAPSPAEGNAAPPAPAATSPAN